MSDNGTFTRTINIYVDSGEAQAAYDKLAASNAKLTGKVNDLQVAYDAALNKAAVEGTKKAIDAAAKLGAELDKTKGQVDNNTSAMDRLSKKISGELSASLKDLQATSRKLNAELNQMSHEDAGFAEKTKHAKEAKEALDQYLVSLGRTKAAAHAEHGESKMGEIFKIATGVGVEQMGEAVIDKIKDTLKESLEEAVKEEDIQSRLKNSLEGVGRMDIFKHLNEQAEELGKKFKFVLPDDIKDTEDRLVTFGKLSKNQIDELMPVIIDFSAKMRKTLPEATDIMLKGFAGLEGMDKSFHKLGVELDKNGSFAANYSAIMGQLAPKVAGAGEALDKTAKGGLQEISVFFTESKKWLGEQMLPALLGIVHMFKSVAESSESLVDTFKKQDEKVKVLTTDINPLLSRYDELKGKTNLTKDEQTELKGIIEKVAGVIPSAITEVDAYGKALGLNTEQAREFIKQQKLLLELKNKAAIDDQTTALEKLEKQYASTSQSLNTLLGGVKEQAQHEIFVKPFIDDKDIPRLVKRTGPMTAIVKQDLDGAIQEFQLKKGELAEKIKDTKLLLSGLKGEKPEDEKSGDDDKALDNKYKKFDLTKITGIEEKLQSLNDELKRTEIGSAAFVKLQAEIKETKKLLDEALGKGKDNTDEWKKFLEKVSQMQAELAAKEDSADASELLKLREKFNGLEQEAKKFYTKGTIGLAEFNKMRLQLASLYQQELADLEDKQFDSRSEKEYTASQGALTKYYETQKLLLKDQFAHQLLGKDEYEKKVEALDSESKRAQYQVFLDYEAEKIAAAKGDAAKLAKIEEDKQKFQNGIYNQDIDNYTKAQARKNAATNSQDKADVITTGMGEDPEAKKQARLKQLEDELAQKLALIQGNEAAINEAQAEAAQKRQAIEKQYYDEVGSDVKKYGDDAVKIFEGLAKISANVENAQLAKDKQANKQKEDNLKDQLDKKQISQQQYNSAISSINKEQVAEENKIAKEQFALNKGLKLAQAIISVASGVANALGSAPPPMNFINAAIVGACGAVEIGVIASQQFVPKYESGTDSIINGPSHANGGVKMIHGVTGKPIGELEGDEAVISARTARANQPVIQSLLRANGRPIINSTRAIENNRFAQGGFINSTATSSTGQQYQSDHTAGTDMSEVVHHLVKLTDATKQANGKQVTFVKNDYDNFANQQQVVYQSRL